MNFTFDDKIIPKLRFKEFKADWQEKKLLDFCTFFSGGTPSSSNREYYKGEIPFIGSGDIHDSKVFKYISNEALNNSSAKLVKKGDLLYALYGATSGDSAISKIEGAINQAILCLRTNECIEYLNYLLVLNKGKIIRKYLQGGQGNLSANIIKKLKYKIPEIKEQKKIALFISAVDEKLQQLSKKKELLEEYKKGIMQKIFSQEIKFKDDNGNEYPDWEESNLGKVAQITTGNSNRSDSESFGEFVFFDRSIDVRMSSTYLLDTEAIIVAGEGSDFIPRYFKGKFGLHQRTYAVYDFVDSYGKFIFYSIYYFRYFFLKTAVGSTVPSLRINSFTKFPLSLPCMKEQIKISQFFSTIDKKIQSVSHQLEKTKEFKKGLLQQMFV